MRIISMYVNNFTTKYITPGFIPQVCPLHFIRMLARGGKLIWKE